MRILEANPPPNGISVGDGISSDLVDPATSLLIGPGLVLTEPSPGEAEISTPTYQFVSTTVTAVGTDPDLGVGGVAGFNYVQINQMIHLFGAITLGTSPSYGTGAWRFELPFNLACQGPAIIIDLGGVHQLQMQAVSAGLVGAGGNNQIAFTYPDTWPIGNTVRFGDASAWGPLALDDSIQFTVVGETF